MGLIWYLYTNCNTALNHESLDKDCLTNKIKEYLPTAEADRRNLYELQGVKGRS